MVYEDASKHVNIMHGSSAFGDRGWRLRNMTQDFESKFKETETPDSYLVTGYSARFSNSQQLYCFGSDNNASVSVFASIPFSSAFRSNLEVYSGR